VIAGCELPIIAYRSWCKGMETVVEKRGGTGRKRMTGVGEDGEREAQYVVEGWVIGLIGRFGLVGGFRHQGACPCSHHRRIQASGTRPM
jgi:hypothetical protein